MIAHLNWGLRKKGYLKGKRVGMETVGTEIAMAEKIDNKERTR